MPGTTRRWTASETPSKGSRAQLKVFFPNARSVSLISGRRPPLVGTAQLDRAGLC